MFELSIPQLTAINPVLSDYENKELEIVNLTSDRMKHLDEYRLLEDEELKLVRALEKIRAERHDKLALGRSIAMQIEQAKGDLIRLENLEREKNKALEEASFLKDAENQILNIMKAFESYEAAHDYQRTDILFMVAAYLKGKSGFLNANDMGLGKTYEGIVTLFILSELFKQENGRKPNVLWLTKKSLVRTTPKEINKWWKAAKVMTPLIAKNGKDRETILELFEVMSPSLFLANYEFVRTTPKIKDIKWDIIVIDEVHKLKGGANPGGPTAIWSACRELCKDARFNIFLSGTPMVNRPEEMWSYLHIFSPTKFPTVRQFQRNFMQYKEMAGEFKLEIQAKRLLENVLKGQMIARSRFDEDVKIQLPDVTYETIELEMNDKQAIAYQSMRDQFFVWLDGQEEALTAAAIIAQLTRLRQINVWPSGIKFSYLNEFGAEVKKIMNIEDSSKIDEAMEIIDNNRGKQIVLFSTFNEPMDEIKRRCIDLELRCEIVNGDSVNRMGDYESDFQNEKIDVLCINSAMGEGLNLQRNPQYWPGGGSIGIFLDLWWSPARNEQCEARIVRPGSNEPATIYVLENVRSVDGFIKAKLLEKKESFDSIMNSSEVRPKGDWKNLLEGLI